MAVILGQVAPTATTNTALYTVPASKYKTFTQLVVCNRGAGSATYRFAVVASGALGNAHYWYWDVTIAAGATSIVDLPDTRIEAAAIVYVYASTGDLSFTLLGQ